MSKRIRRMRLDFHTRIGKMHVQIARNMDTRVNRCSFPRIPVSCAGIELLTIWEVRALATYQVGGEGARHDSHVRIGKGGQNCVALRTHAGRGELRFAERVLEVEAGSLVLFDFRTLERYRTIGRTWDFWWFEFRPLEPVRLPMDRVLAAPLLDGEAQQCLAVFESLRSEKTADRCAANSGLQALLHRWWAECGDAMEPAESHHAAAVRRLIDAMHRHPERSWTLVEMAASAGMSVSGLRVAFHETTGTSPSKLRNRLRLAHAYERLRPGTRTVAEVASELGFCDPFHFSKAFKREYGFPPSRLTEP
jgi:AraC-like DNA-binding protein